MQGKGRKVTGPNRREMPAIRCQQVASIEPFRNRYDAAIHQPKREIRVLLHEPGGAFQVADADRLEFPPNAKLAYLTQTTLSVDDANRIIDRLKARFPQLVGPPKEDICYATQNRQEAVSMLAGEADLVLVLGSQNSSNSQRLSQSSDAENHSTAASLPAWGRPRTGRYADGSPGGVAQFG